MEGCTQINIIIFFSKFREISENVSIFPGELYVETAESGIHGLKPSRSHQVRKKLKSRTGRNLDLTCIWQSYIFVSNSFASLAISNRIRYGTVPKLTRKSTNFEKTLIDLTARCEIK